MGNWNKQINEFFNNEELMSNIRSGVVLFVALGLGLIYFGLYNQFDFAALLSFKTVGLTVTALLSNWLWRIDIEIRAFNDELRENEDLQSIEDSIEEESNDFVDYVSGLEFIKEWNDEQQTMYNKLTTEQRVTYLNQLIRNDAILGNHWYQIRKRSTAKLHDELDRLCENDLIDNSFKPITLNQLISVQKIKKNKERKGQDSIEYNPKRDGTVRGLIFSLVKFVGIGGGGGIAFGITDSGVTILIYYLMLLAALAWTTFRRYPKVRKNTRTTYYQTRKNKLNLIKEMKEFKSQKKLPMPQEVD